MPIKGVLLDWRVERADGAVEKGYGWPAPVCGDGDTFHYTVATSLLGQITGAIKGAKRLEGIQVDDQW